MSQWCCFRESYVDDMMKSLTLALTVLPPWRYVAMSFTWKDHGNLYKPCHRNRRRHRAWKSVALWPLQSGSLAPWGHPARFLWIQNDRNMFTQNPGLLVIIPELGSLGVGWCRMLTYPMNPMFMCSSLGQSKCHSQVVSIALVIPMGHVSAARNRGNRASPVKSTIVILIFYLNQGLERQVSRQTCSILSFSTHCYIMWYPESCIGKGCTLGPSGNFTPHGSSDDVTNKPDLTWCQILRSDWWAGSLIPNSVHIGVNATPMNFPSHKESSCASNVKGLDPWVVPKSFHPFSHQESGKRGCCHSTPHIVGHSWSSCLTLRNISWLLGGPSKVYTCGGWVIRRISQFLRVLICSNYIRFPWNKTKLSDPLKLKLNQPPEIHAIQCQNLQKLQELQSLD